MKINKTILATIVVAASFAPLVSYAVDTDKLKHGIKEAQGELATAAKDAAITARLKVLFAAQSEIPSLKISIKTKEQVVYLSGWLDTVLQANKMVEIAQSVSRVKDVNVSNLKVSSKDSFFDDALTTAKVKGKISQLCNDNKIANNNELHIETTNKNVHIFGKVYNYNDVKEIEFAATSVSGVKKVSTDIEIATG